MQPTALAAALAAGSGPAIVIAQAGQINTGAFDPCVPIAEICRAHGAWLHVDGAFGLWARLLPEMAAMCAGIELADSWCTDGHKWLQLPYDSGFAIVRDSDAHRRAMSITASYLPTIAGAEYDPGPFVPELSRRARGFAAWAVIRALGREGITAMVRRHCALARRVAERLAAEPGVQVLNDVCLNQIILQFGAGTPEQRDALTRTTIEQLHKDNIVLAGGTDWHGRWALRLSVISNELDEADIDRLVSAILSAWHAVQRAGAA
jgi:glutamate/tyrosine decarboxylase-like PLP-dependent enzyme